MTERRKSFRLYEVVLSVITIVFVAEAAAPAAAIGNSQYFWWVFLILAFLLPYGLIAAELGSAYQDEGGLYDWIKRAFGPKWGARAAWYYWINYPLWISSLAVIFPEVITSISGNEISVFWATVIELAFIWTVVFISLFRVSDSKWILNLSAVIKVFIALVLGCLGLYVAFTRGMATEFTWNSLLPSMNLSSLAYVSVILFNFMGFEVLNSFTSEMENPRRQVPQAIVAGGIAIAFLYIFSSFGIGVAIPAEEINTSNGLVESLQLLTGTTMGTFITIMGTLFLISLVGNMLSWSYGVNYVASYAAKNNSMPAIFGRLNEKTGMPLGAPLVNGLVASTLVIIAPFLPSQDLFWNFFALNIVTLLLAYVAVFPAFLKLRQIDPDRERPFKIPGGEFRLRIIAYLPMVLLLIAIMFSVVPLELSAEELSFKIPLTVGTILAIIAGEIMAARAVRVSNNSR